MKALNEFMAHFGIAPEGSPRRLLGSVVRAFASLPYENITKIIKREEFGSPEKARRYPEEVIHDHIAWGTGGTCFSLTSTLMQLVRSLGWEAEYILADRRYGQDTHCALHVSIDGTPHLLDPGYLIIDPIPLHAESEREIKTSFNSLVLTPEANQNRISLSTVQRGKQTYRLTYKTSPIDAGEFCKAWDASFGWEMMRYPLLARTANSKQIYLQGSRLQISDAESVERREIAMDELIAKIAAEFRIHPSVVARVVSILKDRGEIGGKTSNR
jgi:arylamine N-acetyltransferase